MFSLKALSLIVLCIMLLSLGASLTAATRHHETGGQGGWATARRDASGQAPDPQRFARLAIVQVYAAPTYGWKGAVAVHPWIIYKRAGETRYTRY
ncbi:MAG TPA: DUF3750 domain-containing protein, partial [Erwinia persicina]|nr:DUF3750 domain-containing protein [Erwinia persicina]